MSALMERGEYLAPPTGPRPPRSSARQSILDQRAPLPTPEPGLGSGNVGSDARAAVLVGAIRDQVLRQVGHWTEAVEQLADREALAPPQAWANLERLVGVALRDTLDEALARLRAQVLAVRAELAAARTPAEVEKARQSLVSVRRAYTRTSTLVTFFTHAVACRASEKIALLLRACDVIAGATMTPGLTATGRTVPPVLSYLDQSGSLGAAIMRAGLRLWDGGSVSKVASIKVAMHALCTPTFAAHEGAHQVGFTTGLNDELAVAFAGLDPVAGPIWAGWASEVLADAIAVAALGYGPVVLLHDVVAGDAAHVSTVIPGDPHPPALLRVPFNCACARVLFGPGPWDLFEQAWLAIHPVSQASAGDSTAFRRSMQRMPDLAAAALTRRYTSLGGRSLVEVYRPAQVSPQALDDLERIAGPALWTSSTYLQGQPLRMLALDSYRLATEPDRVRQLTAHMCEWLSRLGQLAT